MTLDIGLGMPGVIAFLRAGLLKPWPWRLRPVFACVCVRLCVRASARACVRVCVSPELDEQRFQAGWDLFWPKRYKTIETLIYKYYVKIC